MTTFNIFHTTRVRIGVRDAPHIWGAGEIRDAGERRLFGGLARSEPFVTPHVWGTGEMSTKISATYLGRCGNKHWKSRRIYVALGHDELNTMYAARLQQRKNIGMIFFKLANDILCFDQGPIWWTIFFIANQIRWKFHSARILIIIKWSPCNFDMKYDGKTVHKTGPCITPQHITEKWTVSYVLYMMMCCTCSWKTKKGIPDHFVTVLRVFKHRNLYNGLIGSGYDVPACVMVMISWIW